MEKISTEIVQMAFERNEVDKFLLGEPPYTIPPSKFTPTPKGIITDMDGIESGLYQFKKADSFPSI